MGFKMVLYGLICLNMFDMFNMANQQTQWAKASSSLCKRLPEDLRAYWDIHGIMECERGLFFIDSIEVHCCLFALCVKIALNGKQGVHYYGPNIGIK